MWSPTAAPSIWSKSRSHSSADIAGQTREVLASIDRLLAQAGSDKSRLLMVTIYLTDMRDYPAMNEVWDVGAGRHGAGPRLRRSEAGERCLSGGNGGDRSALINRLRLRLSHAMLTASGTA